MVSVKQHTYDKAQKYQHLSRRALASFFHQWKKAISHVISGGFQLKSNSSKNFFRKVASIKLKGTLPVYIAKPHNSSSEGSFLRSDNNLIIKCRFPGRLLAEMANCNTTRLFNNQIQSFPEKCLHSRALENKWPFAWRKLASYHTMLQGV